MKRREIAAQVRRDRRVLGRRAVHRHAGEALLERDVRAARLRGRRAPRAGDPARRRGAGRRRRRVPAAVSRAHGGPERVGPHGRLRLAPDAGGRAALRPRDLAREGRGRRSTGRAPTSSPHYLQSGRRQRARAQAWPDLETAPGDDLVRLRSVRVVDERRARRRRGRRSRAGRHRDRVHACSRTGEPDLPEDQGLRRARATSPSTRWTRARAGSSRAARRLRRDRVDPRQLPERGAHDRRRRRLLARGAEAPSARGQRDCRRRSTSRTRARATRRADRSPGSGRASCGRCSSGRPRRARRPALRRTRARRRPSALQPPPRASGVGR